MGWLKDLLSPNQSYCCGETARKQRIAHQWDRLKQAAGLVDGPTKRAKTAAEYYLEYTPVVSRLLVYNKGIQLQWDLADETVVLYIHPKTVLSDRLYLAGDLKSCITPSVEKINEILKKP